MAVFYDFHNGDTKARERVVLGCCITFIIVSTIAIGLRLWSRRIARIPLWWDDYFILLGYLSSTICNVLAIAALRLGFPGHLLELPVEDMLSMAKLSYGLQLNVVVMNYLIKVSILFSIYRIFVMKCVRRMCQAAMVACTIWVILAVFLLIFQCTPVDHLWNFMSPGHCLPWKQLVLSLCGFNFLLDIIVLIIPMPTVCSLQVASPRKKAGLIAIFSIGALTCAMNIPRIMAYNAISPFDITYTGYESVIWNSTQAIHGVVVACLPSMLPLFRKASKNMSTWRASKYGHDPSSSSRRRLTPSWAGWGRMKVATNAPQITSIGLDQRSRIFMTSTDDTSRILMTEVTPPPAPYKTALCSLPGRDLIRHYTTAASKLNTLVYEEDLEHGAYYGKGEQGELDSDRESGSS